MAKKSGKGKGGGVLKKGKQGGPGRGPKKNTKNPKQKYARNKVKKEKPAPPKIEGPIPRKAVPKAVKRKAPAPEVSEEQGKKKPLTARQQRRKEVTKLYSTLINPSRTEQPIDLVSDILKLLEARASSLALYCSKEIGSRVVQACLKWGNAAQRREVLGLLKKDIPKLSTDRHGHVVVLKLLRYITRTMEEVGKKGPRRKATDEEKKARGQNIRDFLEAFHGKTLHQVFYHRRGCKVINGIYFSEAVSAREKRRILHELAVPATVALTRSELPGSRALRQLLRDTGGEAGDAPKGGDGAALVPFTAEQRATTVKHLLGAVGRAVDKELLGYDIVHLLFQATCEALNEAQLRELTEKSMGGAPYLLSSKAGAECVMRLLGAATAKEKRDLCRDLKGKFVALATNAVDYAVLMRLASTVDDTVLLTKTMLSEWLADLESIVFDRYGSRVLASILAPEGDKRAFLLSPYEKEFLALPAPASLKAAGTRREELLKVLKEPLKALLKGDALKAACDPHGKAVLTAYLAADWDAEIIDALLAAGAKEELTEEGELGQLSSGTATTTFLALLKLQPQNAEPDLAMSLWQRCLEPRLLQAATSRCAFLLSALLKRPEGSETTAATKAVTAALKKKRQQIAAAIKEAEGSRKSLDGAKKLLAAIDEAGK